MFITTLVLENGVWWDGGGLGSHKVDYSMGALLFFNADLGKIKDLKQCTPDP